MIYKIHLSNNTEVEISNEEFEYFKQNTSASFLEFEAGVINPSFIVDITIDKEESKKQNLERINKLGKGNINEGDYEKFKELYYAEDGGVKNIKSMDQLLSKYDSKIKQIENG